MLYMVLSQRLLCGIVIGSSGVLCACVFSYRLSVHVCVEAVDNACAIADTLLNGVRAAVVTPWLFLCDWRTYH